MHVHVCVGMGVCVCVCVCVGVRMGVCVGMMKKSHIFLCVQIEASCQRRYDAAMCAIGAAMCAIGAAQCLAHFTLCFQPLEYSNQKY